MGPKWFMPSLSKTRGVPVVEAACGDIWGIWGQTRDRRDLFAYKGEVPVRLQRWGLAGLFCFHWESLSLRMGFGIWAPSGSCHQWARPVACWLSRRPAVTSGEFGAKWRTDRTCSLTTVRFGNFHCFWYTDETRWKTLVLQGWHFLYHRGDTILGFTSYRGQFSNID